jgi:hypothetical protein
MVPDPYPLEKMVLAHHQQLQCEAVHEQMLGARPSHSSHWMLQIAAKLRAF